MSNKQVIILILLSAIVSSFATAHRYSSVMNENLARTHEAEHNLIVIVTMYNDLNHKYVEVTNEVEYLREANQDLITHSIPKDN